MEACRFEIQRLASSARRRNEVINFAREATELLGGCLPGDLTGQRADVSRLIVTNNASIATTTRPGDVRIRRDETVGYVASHEERVTFHDITTQRNN